MRFSTSPPRNANRTAAANARPGPLPVTACISAALIVAPAGVAVIFGAPPGHGVAIVAAPAVPSGGSLTRSPSSCVMAPLNDGAAISSRRTPDAVFSSVCGDALSTASGVSGMKSMRVGAGVPAGGVTSITMFRSVGAARMVQPTSGCGSVDRTASIRGPHVGSGRAAGLVGTSSESEAPPGMQTSLQMSQSAFAPSVIGWPVGHVFGTVISESSSTSPS